MVSSTPPIFVLQIVVEGLNKAEFLSLLPSSGLRYEELLLKALPPAAGTFIDVMQGSAPWAASLAAVICAYLKNARSRKVIITTGSDTVIHAEGLSQAEIMKLLEQSRNVLVDTGERQT